MSSERVKRRAGEIGEAILSAFQSVDGNVFMEVREHPLQKIEEGVVVTGGHVTLSVEKGRVEIILKEASHSAIVRVVSAVELMAKEEGLAHAHWSKVLELERRVVGMEGVEAFVVVGPGAVSAHELDVGELQGSSETGSTAQKQKDFNHI